MADVQKEYSARDREIWIATYAAAFVNQVQRFRDIGVTFDRAVEATGAETAFRLADAAVDQLQRWEAQEGKVGPIG